MRPEVYDVMFATATTASLKKTNDVVIMLKNHERALHVNAGGKVTATDISLAQFFSMESVGDIFSETFKIALYAKEVGRYLCFRRGKLVGMKNMTRDCHFIESLDHGYFLYANAYNPLWRVGFTKGLKPVGPRHWKRPQTLKRACFLFVKINAEHFDRSRFTTTTTAAPTTKALAAVTLREGHNLHDSKASIIDSNSNNYKRTKSADSGNHRFHINSKYVNATAGRNRQWHDREAQRLRHRKRKHHAKLAAGNGVSSSGLLQPKNLVRHHHDQGNGEGRRRQHHREERERKMRSKNQRTRQQQQADRIDPEPMPNATNSASPSVAATTLAATASLAPSALNIVAMLAAGRRKRSRRKKPADSSVTSLSSNSSHHHAMDLQLVAQSPLQAQSQYDRVPLNSTKSRDHQLGHHHHEHNYHQKHQQTIAPVSSTSPSTKEAIKGQQQIHKYSNSDSQLHRRSSGPRKNNNKNSNSSSSGSSSSSINSHNLSHNFNLNLNHNVNNINSNNNNNDNVNAIPAWPKKYLSKNNFNHEYSMQQTTRGATDFNKKQEFSHSTHSIADREQSQPHTERSDHSHTSHNFNKFSPSLKQQKVTSENVNDNDNDSDDYNDRDDDNDSHEKNSNRLLVNNSNVSDNNLLQEHLVNRFKLIYLDRIRSHSFNMKLNTNNNNYIQHSNNKNSSPISSTTITITTATNEKNHSIFENFKEARHDFSSLTRGYVDANSTGGSNGSNNGNSSSDSNSYSSIKNGSSRGNFNTSTTSNYNHSHRRTKRNLIYEYITNNNNNINKDNSVNNYNKNNAKSSSSLSQSVSNSNSSRSRSSHSSNSKNINSLQNHNVTKVNILKNSKRKYLKFLMPSATAYRYNKLLTFLGRQQQQQHLIKHTNNPNKYNYNNYNVNDYDDGEELKKIQNKYEKIIVQYRSVFNCLETKYIYANEMVSTAYGLCQDYLPPDGICCVSIAPTKPSVDLNHHVVISGALCTVEDYVIMSQCAHNKAINLAAEGTVSVTDISQTQNITIVGRPDFVNNNFKIALYAKETQRYLCFNDHWKLVGMKELQDTCYFNEAIVHGYFVFRSVVDSQRRIGFTQRGRAVGPKKTVNDACYMFTKIPTDQFFHQHTHFSAPKTKSTTTKVPKAEYTHAPYSTHVWRGSGGGRTKANRLKTQRRQDDDSVTHNRSGSGHGDGSGSGSGSGNGSGNGNANKKFRKQRNGNKQRQQKLAMQQQFRGHSYNFNNPKNSTYLNSSRQNNLVLSQHSINNHTNRKHNNKNHPPQNHQVRHHHNDPNKIAKRQQHDQKQKTKMRLRAQPSPSSSSTVTTATITTTRIPSTTPTTSLTTPKAINSTKPHDTLASSYMNINPTSVVPTISTVGTSDISHDTMTSTAVVTKRKGRRRNGEKLNKIGLRNKIEGDEEYVPMGSTDNYKQDYMTSSTDYAWMTNDIMLSSIEPTSASLPSWESWYPSSPTSHNDEDSSYSSISSASAGLSSVNDPNIDKRFSTTLKSSSIDDFDKNTLYSQPSVLLPTSVLSTTLAENGIDDTLSPTATTTDLGMTTTNTSTYTQMDLRASSLSDKMGPHVATISFDTYATPKLESTQNAINVDEAFLEDTNSLSTAQDSENSTAAISLTTIDGSETVADIFSSPPTADRTADDATTIDGSIAEVSSIQHYEQSSKSTATTTISYSNDCTSNRNKSMTDCTLATKTPATLANNHKHKQVTTKETTSSSLNTIPLSYDKNIILPETTSTMPHSSASSSLSQPSKILTTAKSMQHLLPAEAKITRAFHGAKTRTYPDDTLTPTAAELSPTMLSNKSPLISPLPTRKSVRKSTQRMLATPFHQLTYVRNKAADIDIDSIDNISIYPDLLDNDSDELLVKSSTSRLTMISGYLPTSATATLPESIRIAKVKINRERKRMLRLRNVGNYT